MHEEPKNMKTKSNEGFTLIELLVAMAITSIIMAAMVSAYQLQVRGKNTQEALTDMNQTLRTALEIMTNEIRTAGLDTVDPSAAIAGIVTANANQLRFTMDIGDAAGTTLQPDGAVNGPNEDVTYQLYVDGDGNQNLGRNTGGGLQPLARNVDALDFVYLDANGNPGAIGTNIRNIQVTIVARAGEVGGVGFVGRHTDTTAYQNQQGTVILPAQNDAYRRLLLTTTIQCRNLGV
jgi:type IV pilus assembly protein PilW